MRLSELVLCGVSAVMMVSCTTSKQASATKDDLAKSARAIFGTELIGTRGATSQDQDNIDDTVAGACAVGAYKADECRQHTLLTQQNKREPG